MTPDDINRLIEFSEEHSATAIKPDEAAFIFDFIQDNGIKKTLETGFAYGMSAVHIMAATQAKHIACDPWQDYFDNLGLKNAEKLGLSHLLEFHQDYSHNVLPKLLSEQGKFDFVFIDADHKFDAQMIDFYYADLLLENEGFILLHDTWMRTTRMLMSFIRTNRKDYKHIPTGQNNLALFQKVGSDQRDGMHFREFYTFRSFISHYGTLYTNQGKSNILKRALSKIRRLKG